MRYRHLEFCAGSPKPTSKELVAIERAVGAKLPDDFEAFLRDANGAVIPYALYVATDEVEDSLNFREIFSTTGSGEDTFLRWIAEARARWGIPSRVLPFARAYGDSVAFLDLRPESHGAVLAILQGEHGGTGRMREPPFVRVADSFAAYVDRLVPELSDEALGGDCREGDDARDAGRTDLG